MHSTISKPTTYKPLVSTFERIKELELEFDHLPVDSPRREQNVHERLKLLGINIE